MLEEINKRLDDVSTKRGHDLYDAKEVFAAHAEADIDFLLSLILTSKELDTIGYWYDVVRDMEKEALTEEDHALYKRVMELKKKVEQGA